MKKEKNNKKNKKKKKERKNVREKEREKEKDGHQAPAPGDLPLSLFAADLLMNEMMMMMMK